jgi:hypothetical protein
MIEQQFGLTYHLHSIYKLLHRLGYSYVSSRPEHLKGDPETRETFKKKSLIRSGNSVLIILERPCRCGFRMKPGSVNRER